jgi:formylglycine-generating enzyme required for sulfatase activity
VEQKRRFLAKLAFDLQSSAAPEDLGSEVCLQVERRELRRRLEGFLEESLGKGAVARAESLLERLHSRDAILVNYGEDQFGFVHRSFQEYFAAHWIAEEHSDFGDFRDLLFAKGWIDRPGWNETLYLAFAQLSRPTQGKMLVELLKRSRVEVALECMETGAEQDLWLRNLVQFLSKYFREGQEHAGIPAEECAERCQGRTEMEEVLEGLFDREQRDGRSLAAGVELAEELERLGNADAQRLLAGFLGESPHYGLERTGRMVLVEAGQFLYGEKGVKKQTGAFCIDRYLVTNRDYECMIPRHRQERDQYSDADDQPVIYVNWHEVRLFCRWRGTGFRLPAEEEWEKAASWEPVRRERRVYPWGNEFDPAKCNVWESGLHKTTPMGAHPSGASAYGCYEMAGNVWEWMASQWSKTNTKPVVRGGSWRDLQQYAACASRYYDHPQRRHDSGGFRCARTCE